MTKKDNLKARGIRFSEAAWNKIVEDANKQQVTPSEIVRVVINKFYKIK